MDIHENTKDIGLVKLSLEREDVVNANHAVSATVLDIAIEGRTIKAARARLSAKRGGHLQREEHSGAPDLDQIPDLSSRRDGELVAIHEALDGLVRIDARKARVIELRFFGGMSVDETAVVLAVSPQTVMRDWKLAKAWLTRELKKKGLGSNRLPGN